MQPDFEYYVNGIWVSFMPNTPQAIRCWNDFAEKNAETGVTLGDIFITKKEEVIARMRKAGYSVRKGAPRKSSKNDDALLAALGVVV